MSVQFGRWNFDDKPVDRDYLERVTAVISPYGPDGGTSFFQKNITMLYRAFHTTKESRFEHQPRVSSTGYVITWDGRLDNRRELIHDLRDVLAIESTDVDIVAAAYERWGTDCFARLIGDWALVIWNSSARSVILAKDFAGIRHLFYSFDQDQVTWSSILDPLVLFADRRFALCEEYIAGWLSFFPATPLTPYTGIHSVPPSSFVVLRPGTHTVHKYWDFDPAKKIRYRDDAEYEVHFRSLFAQAVGRRLRSDSPILAELSGGMDSSSIVCVADAIIALGAAETPRLDTISRFNDSEPNWDECPYFTKVEEKRGRIGCHVDTELQHCSEPESGSPHFATTPGSGGRADEISRRYAACMASQGNRVVLSGLGGDEMTGGVPTPSPELQDLLVTARFRHLVRQLKLWALNKRKPWFHLLFDAVQGFLPSYFAPFLESETSVPWLNPRFKNHQRAPLSGYRRRLTICGSLPSFQVSLAGFEALRRQLTCHSLQPEALCEKRFPFLDQDLLEFMCALPREQLVRPGQRRSLMRRALVGIVPDEVLNRKRKAFVARGLRTAISLECVGRIELDRSMTSDSLGIVSERHFSVALRKARNGEDIPTVAVLRTLALERWLRNLSSQEFRLTRENHRESDPNAGSSVVTEQTIFSAENISQQKGGGNHDL
jgi:asparagine synthase (glutamine-hydrolysing)